MSEADVQSSKKQRVEEPVIEEVEVPISVERNTPSAVCLTENEEVEEVDTEDAVLSTTTAENLHESCVVCFESGCEENSLLESHNCRQCRPDAWKICHSCDESLLSRTCPVCRGDYAPLILHACPFKISREMFVSSGTLDAEVAKELLVKFNILKQLIPKSNIAIIIPSESRILFSLHKYDDDQSSTCNIISSIPITPEKFVDGKFQFSNAVWDDLEAESETGNGAEEKSHKETIELFLKTMNISDSVLLTPLPHATWQDLLEVGLSCIA